MLMRIIFKLRMSMKSLKNVLLSISMADFIYKKERGLKREKVGLLKRLALKQVLPNVDYAFSAASLVALI